MEERRELATVLKVPPAPYGGDLAVTVGEAGDIGGTFRANKRPLFGFGGESAVGSELDLGGRLTAYVRQDVLRVGKVQSFGKAYASYTDPALALPGFEAAVPDRARGVDYGVAFGVELRWGRPR